MNTPDGQARTAALAIAASAETVPAAIVPYASAGSLLIIGEEGPALAAAAECQQQEIISTTVLVMERGLTTIKQHRQGGLTVLSADVTELTGYLGMFRMRLAAADTDAVLDEITRGRQVFDIVIDLTTPALIGSELPPPGYFAPGADAAVLQQALEEVPALVGEFEKPQFFNYNASICVHGRSGMTACTRCIAACPTDAIGSLGNSIEVDSGLCQGAGSCATACPTGAISYSYPRLSDSLNRLRAMLTTYRDKGGADPVVLFHDGEAGRDAVMDVAAQLPEYILPVELEELGSIGMDSWLSALAYGAAAVVLLGTPGAPASVIREIRAQLEVAHALLGGIGHDASVLSYTDLQDAHLVDSISKIPKIRHKQPAAFAGLDEKRTVIRLAVEHLFEQADSPTRPLVTLPTGAPFGEVLLDQARCTLCMACVSQCPASALSAGDESPQLGFTEANCVQCGLCCRTCPEDAIAISPRYLYDFTTRNSRRVLYEEEPFACIVCGKPFATRSIIENISKKMQAHAMFQGAALQRIKMCEDCRVNDIYGDADSEAHIKIDPSANGQPS
ncbi:MAG: 4Fe-4S binding protein [Gammaproteobacteria bacterium]|nr:4Fe-4S binding protein [Gammaproteobacteria bacterium]MDH3984922.1 4Fe-4S binding protein [Gammaproteobacteria bacterium]